MRWTIVIARSGMRWNTIRSNGRLNMAEWLNQILVDEIELNWNDYESTSRTQSSKSISIIVHPQSTSSATKKLKSWYRAYVGLPSHTLQDITRNIPKACLLEVLVHNTWRPKAACESHQNDIQEQYHPSLQTSAWYIPSRLDNLRHLSSCPDMLIRASRCRFDPGSCQTQVMASHHHRRRRRPSSLRWDPRVHLPSPRISCRTSSAKAVHPLFPLQPPCHSCMSKEIQGYSPRRTTKPWLFDWHEWRDVLGTKAVRSGGQRFFFKQLSCRFVFSLYVQLKRKLLEAIQIQSRIE